MNSLNRRRWTTPSDPDPLNQNQDKGNIGKKY